MLDMKYLRNHLEEVKQKLQHRGEDLSRAPSVWRP
jgi:seryl-tRNA synthetase